MFHTWARQSAKQQARPRRGGLGDYWDEYNYGGGWDDYNFGGGGYDFSYDYGSGGEIGGGNDSVGYWDVSTGEFVDTSGWNTGPVSYSGTQWNFQDTGSIFDGIDIFGGGNDQYIPTVGYDPNLDLNITPIPYLDYPTIQGGDIDSIDVTPAFDNWGMEIIPYADPISGLTLDLKPFEPYPLPPNATPAQKTDWKKKLLDTAKKAIAAQNAQAQKGGASGGASGAAPKTQQPQQGKCPTGYTLNPQSNLCVQNPTALASAKPGATTDEWWKNPLFILAIAGGALLLAMNKR